MTKDKLIAALNEDLSYELSAIIQYAVYAAKVTGPYRPQLVSFFEAEIPDETAHAKYLANKIVALGGEPTTQARPVAPAATNHELLEEIVKSESSAVTRYTQRAREAEELGFKGLQVQLEDMVRDETQHKEEAERILQDWSV